MSSSTTEFKCPGTSTSTSTSIAPLSERPVNINVPKTCSSAPKSQQLQHQAGFQLSEKQTQRSERFDLDEEGNRKNTTKRIMMMMMDETTQQPHARTAELADVKSQTYHSPSDNLLSPTSRKLSEIKGKRFGKAKPQSLFAKTVQREGLRSLERSGEENAV